jgi:hypothetical protein
MTVSLDGWGTFANFVDLMTNGRHQTQNSRLFAEFVVENSQGRVTRNRIATMFQLGHDWVGGPTSPRHFQMGENHLEEAIELRRRVEELEGCLAEATLEKQRKVIEVAELAMKLERSEKDRELLIYLGGKADEDMKKAECERDIGLQNAQSAETKMRAAQQDLIAVAAARDSALVSAGRAHEEVLRKSMQYGLAVRLIRNLKAAKAKFELAHANVARKSQALAELFDYGL